MEDDEGEDPAASTTTPVDAVPSHGRGGARTRATPRKQRLPTTEKIKKTAGIPPDSPAATADSRSARLTWSPAARGTIHSPRRRLSARFASDCVLTTKKRLQAAAPPLPAPPAPLSSGKPCERSEDQRHAPQPVVGGGAFERGHHAAVQPIASRRKARPRAVK